MAALLAEPVTSAASRSAESTSEAPATIWSISGTDLKRYGIQSIEEAIRFLGHGMTAYEYDSRLNAAFGARGYLSQNLGLHLAVLIDGNQAGGSAKTARGTQQYMMPIELVDHIEVVLGPGSVVYGNSAMLGVINVVTRAAESIEGTTVVAQASGGLPADKWTGDLSWGEAWGRAAGYGATSFQLGSDPFHLAWHLAVRWDRQLGRSVWRLTGTDAYTDSSLYSREDVFNRDLHGRLFARATWGRWKFLSWLAYGQGTGTGPVDGAGASSYVEPEYGLDASWSRPIGDRGDLTLRGYALVFDSSTRSVSVPVDTQHCLDAVGQSGCVKIMQYVTIRPFFEPLFTWDWMKNGSQVTTVGGQAFIDGSLIITGDDSLDGSTVIRKDPILAPLPVVAAYVQHVLRGSFGTLNAGVRGDLGLLGRAVSPRLALSKDLWSNGTGKLIFSTGFRTPTVTERYFKVENFLIDNPEIGPERVYSAELDLAQRLGSQSLQIALFGTLWQGLINTRTVQVNGVGVWQFANLREVWSAGVNVGWQGAAGPLDFGLSANYAPGRIRLPAGVAQYSDQQLAEQRLQRETIEQYGVSALGAIYLPTEAMPDFYATGHLSYSLGLRLPRFSLAAHLASPRPHAGYENDARLLDPRNVDGPWLPWSLDLRGAVEAELSQTMGYRLFVTGRTLSTVPANPRVGLGFGPVPSGGVGQTTNPISPLSAMAELYVRL